MGDSSSSGGWERAAGLVGMALLGPDAIDEFRSRRQGREALKAVGQHLASFKGDDEATQIAGLLSESPQVADTYVRAVYGSWPKLFEGIIARQELSKSADIYEKGLSLAGPPRNPGEAAARSLLVGSLRGGVAPPSPAYNAQMFSDPESMNPAAWGISPQFFTGESIAAAMESVPLTGKPDYTLLRQQKDAGGGASQFFRLPSGYAVNPQTGEVEGIPGTEAELESRGAKMWRRALSEIEARHRGAREKGEKLTYGLPEYFKETPEDKAIFDALASKPANPLEAFMLEALQRGMGGAAAPTTPAQGGKTPGAEDVLNRIRGK